MAGLLDRVRDLLRPASSAHAEGWDDEDVQDVAPLVATLAAAWDPEPGDPRIAASRASVLGAFAAATAERQDHLQGAPGRPLPPAGAAPEVRRGGRRPAFVLIAAGLLLAMSLGTVVASAPGGPLYEARVASEGALLPADPDARVAAQVERLQARVAEATGAATRGDEGGLQAALRAYARVATETASGPAPGPAAAPSLAARVRTQLEVIAGFDGGSETVAAREQARVAARALLGRLGEPAGGDGPGPSGSAAPSPIGPPSPSGPPSSSPGGGGSPRGTGGPPASAGPGASTTPGGAQGSPSPAGSGGPSASSGPRATTSPRATPVPTPRTTPAPTPRTTARPSPTSGGGPGSGSPGGGASPTPAPGGGSGQGGSGSGASPSPGGRP